MVGETDGGYETTTPGQPKENQKDQNDKEEDEGMTFSNDQQDQDKPDG